VNGGLLVAGTSSDAGKSVLTLGICRWLRRQGVRVAPFKAQNMSNNSAVTPDGAEIGRAQIAQAAACETEPEAAMNPVLLKPGSDHRSHVVLLGLPYGEAGAMDYRGLRETFREVAFTAFDDLRSRFDVVVCEGAGSPAEINLREGDFVNMGLATARDLPVIVVADIDRGGVFASLYGTVALLSPGDQGLISAFVINKFRGDKTLLAPGLETLTRLTGRPILGVVPWHPGLALDTEDSLSLDSALRDEPHAHTTGLPSKDQLRVAVVRLPRISNFTDVDALAAEPGVVVTWATSPVEIAAADLTVVPGTRATVHDLAWLRTSGIAAALEERAATGRPVLGICGGYQMLARSITDHVESRIGTVAGLDLLPVDVRFMPEKTLGRPTGWALGQPVTTAFEIHHGVAEVDAAQDAEPFLDGCRRGSVYGTTWHGALESDGFRRAFLRDVAERAGSCFTPVPSTSFAAVRAARFDAIGDLVADHLDTGSLERLIERGAPAGLRALAPGACF
jgi:adenosylcobyric acid synthase